MWWTTRDGQGCHDLLPTTTVPWGGTHFLASTKLGHHVPYLVLGFLLMHSRETPLNLGTKLEFPSPSEKTRKTNSDKQERELKLN